MKLDSLFSAARTRVSLLILLCVALLVVVGLGRSGLGASAVSLFQSPASPVDSEEPIVEPAPTVQVEAGTEPVSEGLSIPIWAYFVAAVIVLVLAAVFLLLRSRR